MFLKVYHNAIFFILFVAWNPWNTAGPCSESCGDSGFKERLRTCSTGKNLDCETDGSKFWEVLTCNNGPCGPGNVGLV